MFFKIIFINKIQFVKIKFIRKPCSRSTIYIDFSLYGPLVLEIMIIKDFIYIYYNLLFRRPLNMKLEFRRINL